MTQRTGRVADPAAFGENELRFTPRDFQIIASMLKRDAGIFLEQTKMPLVYARLVRRVRALGLRSFGAYCVLVAGEDGAAERVHMREALTTNITRFFREAHHFEHLKNVVLPPLLKKARKGGRVRLWSAGCSSGEEPYSIALSVLSLMDDAARFDIKILASDIDNNILNDGRKGFYSAAALASVNAQTRTGRFGIAKGDGEQRWQIAAEVRALVTFRTHNLVGSWPMKGPFQVIFCRNTVIYFDEASRSDVWARMAALLAPGGYLYVGHSERLPASLSELQPAGLTVYRKGETSRSIGGKGAIDA